MRATWILAALSMCVGIAQETMPPRLSIHTWVREDIFAGFLFNDLERFDAGVKKLDRMLETNPSNAPAMAWRGGAELYRAVLAHEAGQKAEFTQHYTRATQLFERAYELQPKDQGVLATTGGSYLVFADRLPTQHSSEAWKKAQSIYKALAVAQAAFANQLPLHMRGELLAGLAMTAQRVGDHEEATKYLKQIVDSLPGSPYEARAQKWLDQPDYAAKSSLGCQTCHEPGRLKNRLEALKKQEQQKQ